MDLKNLDLIIFVEDGVGRKAWNGLFERKKNDEINPKFK